LLRTWVMRTTVHLIPTEDAGWWLPIFEPGIEKWSRRRLSQLGMPEGQADKALRVIADALADGPMTRPEAAERVVEAGVKLNANTRLHVIGLAVTSGIACLGPDRGPTTTCLVRREDWLPRMPKFDRDQALAELGRVYLRAFAPATDRDFAYWSGLPLRDVRGALESISKEIEEVEVEGETMLAPRGGLPRLPSEGQIRMLGNFDTYLLGWRDRSFAVSNAHAMHVKEGGGGWIRPVIVRDGVVVGGWRSARKGKRLDITLNLDKEIQRELGDAIEREIADLGRFEGIETTIA
jgi:hypothetical protein